MKIFTIYKGYLQIIINICQEVINMYNKNILKYLGIFLLIFSFSLVSTNSVHSLDEDLFSEEELFEEENLQYFEKLQDIISLLDSYYVEEIERKELFDIIYRGMLDELDEHSHYLDEEGYEDLQFRHEGEYGGIGISVTLTEDEDLVVFSVFEGNPGYEAGLKEGDIIKEVDGKSTEKMDFREAVERMRGKKDTSVELLISREDKEEDFLVEIVRDEIEIPYVSAEMETDRIGYLTISQFMGDSGLKTRDKIQELQDQGAEALIIDLRNNPGGDLNQVVQVVSNFIEDGTVVTVKQRDTENEMRVVNYIDPVEMPVVVLINSASVSGSEIVGGVIQDYERGKLIGTSTYGKGSVQRPMPLNDGTAVSVTIAKYYLPSGRNISESGIDPDIEIEYDPEAEKDNQLQKALEILESELDKK